MENLNGKFILANYKGESEGEAFDSEAEAQKEADYHNQGAYEDYYLALHVEPAQHDQGEQ